MIVVYIDKHGYWVTTRFEQDAPEAGRCVGIEGECYRVMSSHVSTNGVGWRGGVAVTVYVDNAQIPWNGMLMSHLVADSLDELHAMALAIGLKRSWFQDKPRWPHYDVCNSKRARAIELGALAMDGRDLVRRMLRLDAAQGGRYSVRRG